MPRIAVLILLLCPGALLAAAPPAGFDEKAQLRQEIEALRAQQQELAQWQARNEAALRTLEARLGMPEAAPATAAPVAAASTAATSTATASASAPVAAAAPALAQAAQAAPPRLKVSGDLRVRGQADFSDDLDGGRTTNQVRARIGATYAVSDHIGIGARLVTGDPDNPRSSDAQLTNWWDDLDVAFDLAYVQLGYENLRVQLGKIQQPFSRTELVWDGDINPEGASANWRQSAGTGTVMANAIYSPIDERPMGDDSYLRGAQFGYGTAAGRAWRFEGHAAYYGYELDNLTTADAIDLRTNRRDENGQLLSDFHLLDVIATAEWTGGNPRWPIRVVGDYVKNLGAIDDQDTGFGIDVTAGRAKERGDWRITYGYAQTDVDAVLAAFSQDNIAIATNYRMHALTLDYSLNPRTILGGLWYHYKVKDPEFAGSFSTEGWYDRFRLYLLVNF